MNTTKWYPIRWILVLPAAILAYIIGNTIFILIFSGVSKIHFLPKVIDWLTKPVCSVIASLVYVSIGAIVAPTYKKQTVVVLIIIFSIVAGIDLYPNIINKNYEDVWMAFLEVATMTIAYFTMKENDGDEL